MYLKPDPSRLPQAKAIDTVFCGVTEEFQAPTEMLLTIRSSSKSLGCLALPYCQCSLCPQRSSSPRQLIPAHPSFSALRMRSPILRSEVPRRRRHCFVFLAIVSRTQASLQQFLSLWWFARLFFAAVGTSLNALFTSSESPISDLTSLSGDSAACSLTLMAA